MEPIKLSPSTLTFLFDECKRCFYLAIRCNFKRPALPMAKIFTKIDRAMKEHYAGNSGSLISPDLPAGTIFVTEKFIESDVLELPGHHTPIYFSGKIDAFIHFEDGSYGVVDFKTSDVAPHHAAFYGRQLHAYAYSMENPSPRKIGQKMGPVTHFGLLYFSPFGMGEETNGRLPLLGQLVWQELQRDDEAFLRFLDEVLTVLELPEPPEADEDCAFCKYRQQARELQL
jgi:hypothetical protein